MNDIAIRAENLGKLYRIGQIVGYKTLRESVTNVFSRPFRRLRPARQPLPIKGTAQHPKYIWALKDVSFEVEQGEALGIIGRNGSGKSTLLKILSRITSPTEGYAEIRARVASLLEVGTGFHPELNGRENIYLNGAVLGMRRKEIDRKFAEIVDFSGVEKFIDTPLKRYSSGMQVRLAFAIAAHLEPDILLVDEVLAVGDIEFQNKCLGKMEDVTKGGRTVLFVSHNMNAIRRFCPRCILLHDGHIIADGNTDEVVGQYASSIEKAGERVFEPDTAKAAQFLRVNIRNRDSEPAARLEMARPIVVTIEYEIREVLRNVGVACIIMSVDGTRLLGIEDHDLDSSLWQERLPGRYRTHFEIPGNLLNAGKYILRISFGSNRVSYDDHEAFQFEIADTQGLLKWERSGVLAPAFPWTTVRID
jgi:lipopolysaccharide transport system ATP-binding protein